MKTMKTRKSVVILCAIAVLLFIVSFIATTTNTTQAAYASGGEVEKEFNLVLNSGCDLLINTPANYVYVDFACPTTAEYILTVISEGDISTKVLDEKNQEIEVNIIEDKVFSVMLDGLAGYKIGFYTLERETIEVCMEQKSEAFEWRVNGSLTSDERIELDRGEEYILDFYINGNLWNVEFALINDSVYDFTFAGNILSLKDSCQVKGSGITVVASLGKTALSKKTIIPEFNKKIVTKGAYDTGIERGLIWEYQAGITKITYKVDSIGGSIDINDLKYGDCELNLTTDLDKLSDRKENALVSIDTVEILTADNTFAVYEVEDNVSTMTTRLAWVGSGTELDPYQVTSTAHFNDIQSRDASGVYFKQMYTLNFYGAATTRNVLFKGIYDGNGQNIYDIVISSSTPLYDGGLFDRNSGTIKNIRKLIVRMTYTHWGYVGGMVGSNSGTIETPTYSSGLEATLNITSSSAALGAIVGGVAGYNSGTIIMKNSVYVDITSNGIIGGIAGDNTGGIGSNAFALRTILGNIRFNYLTSGADDVGGVAGINNGGTLFMLKVNVFFTLTVPSSSSSYQPRAGGIIGTKKNGGTILGYQFNGGYSSNLTAVQKLYIDFDDDYIGQILP